MADESPASSQQEGDVKLRDLQAVVATLVEQVSILSAELQTRTPQHPPGFTPPHAQQQQVPPTFPEDMGNKETRAPFYFSEDEGNGEQVRNPIRAPPLGNPYGEAAKGKSVMGDDVPSQAGSTHEVDTLRAEFEAKALQMQRQIDILTRGNPQPSSVEWKSGYVAAERLNIPQSLKIPAMDKFDGKRDPAVYMKTFVATMVPLRLGDDALMQLFPRYLTGAAERWYHKTCEGKFSSLDDLATQFIGRFSMHAMIAEPEEQLKQIVQGDGETFRAFMARWTDVASEVDTLPSEDKMVEMVRSSLNREYAMATASRSFVTLNELIIVGRSIDRAAATNQFRQSPSFSTSNAPRVFSTRKPRPEVHNISKVWASLVVRQTQPPREQRFRHEAPSKASSSYVAPVAQTSSAPKSQRAFDDLGRPLSSIFEMLKKRGLLTPLEPPVGPRPQPKFPDRKCAYHQVVGHDTDYCGALRSKVQDLIDTRVIPKPNVVTNPLPKHGIHYIEIGELRVPLDQEIHMISIFNNDEEVKPRQIESSNKGNKGEATVATTVHADFWSDFEGISIVAPPKSKGKGKVSGVNATRRGTNYHPTFMRNMAPAPAVLPTPSAILHPISDKDKESTATVRTPQPADNLLSQMKKTSANVSIWELLMFSIEHRQALLNELGKVQVPNSTSPEEIVAMVTGAPKIPTISFGDHELPASGSSHAKALYITATINGKTVPSILIDNGSALNICPWRTAEQLGITKDAIIPSDLFVKGFDNSKREIMGTIALVVKVAGVTHNVDFTVIDMQPSYNIILGRPWLHQVHAVSSTLHQRLKLVNGGRVITVHGEPTSTSSKSIHVAAPGVELNGYDICPVFVLDEVSDTSPML